MGSNLRRVRRELWDHLVCHVYIVPGVMIGLSGPYYKNKDYILKTRLFRT